MKNKIYCIILLLFFIISIIPVNFGVGQVWENSFGRLEVYPDISRNLIRQKQYYNATWYKAANNLDIAFRFDNPLGYGKVFYWNGTNYNPISNNHVEYNGKHYYVISNIYFEQGETKHGYWEYDTPCNSVGKWDMYIKLSSLSWAESFAQNKIVHLDPWWDSNWDYKKQITLNHSQVYEALVNFPVCINLSSDGDLVNGVGFSDGRDIAFVDSAETTQLNHELELFKSSTGQLCAWVNVTSLSNTVDTTIYMYYGNSAASNQTNSSGVWDSNFVSVYHMNGSSWSNIIDSTGNNHNATAQGDNPSYIQTGVVGYGVEFDGTNDYIELVDNNDFTFSSGGVDQPFTFEGVFKKTDSGVNPIVSKFTNTVKEWFLSVHDNDLGRIYLYDDNDISAGVYRFSTGTYSNDVFSYLAASFNGSDPTIYENLNLIVDGTNSSGTGLTQGNYDVMRNTNQKVRIGMYGASTNRFFAGIIDEVRISDIQRSDAWLNTTYNSIFNASDGGFFSIGSEVGTGTVEAPTGVLAVTDSSDGSIDVNWTMGANSTHTRLEWNTISYWARGSGNLLYNDSLDISYSHTSVSCGSIYYYLLWAYNSTQNNWSGSVAVNNISCPGNPSNINNVAYPSALNITWTMNGYADNTTLVRKSGSLPSGPGDGNELYNGTLTYYNDTSIIYDTHFYKLFSWNSTVGRYSTGATVSIGFLKVNVFDENTSAAINNWSIHVSNQSGSQVYESLDCNNELTIDNSDLPYGLVSILINHSDYESRLYYLTIVQNQGHYLDAFLAEKGEITNYYVIFVQNEIGNPLKDVYVEVSEYDNVSGVFSDVSSQYTDASGQIGVYLIGGKHYKVNLSKTGYDTETGLDYFPDPNYYGIYYPKIYQMSSSTEDEPFYTPLDVIDFKASISSGGIITVEYYDNRDNTENTQIKIFEYYNYTLTLNDTNTRNNDDDFTWTSSGYNTSMAHKVSLWCNHSDFSDMIYMEVFLDPIRTGIATEKTIEDRFSDVFGSFELGYGKTLLVVLPCLLFLVVFGAAHVGLGIMGAGLYMSFSSYLVNISSMESYISIGLMLAFAGFAVILHKHGEKII